MNRKFLALAVITLFMLSGCSLLGTLLGGDSGGGGDSANEIIPLKINYRWVYNVWEFDLDGNVTDSGSFVTVVDRDTTLDDEQWFILTFENNPITIARNDENGYWSRTVATFFGTNNISVIGEPFLSSKFPATVGDSYPSSATDTTHVISTDSSVTVLGVDYTSHLYRRITGNREFPEFTEYFRVPGVGTVRQESFTPGPDDGPRMTLRFELVQFYSGGFIVE